MSDENPDVEEVYDHILGHFKEAWDAGTPAVNGGSVVPVEWPDEPSTESPLNEGTTPWARVTVRHLDRRTTSIGGRVSESAGIVRVSVFVLAGKRGLVESARIGKVALDAFEGQRSGPVWFSDVLPKEVGVDGAWYQYDVTATFRYSNNR
jgi:hypothetical protein